MKKSYFQDDEITGQFYDLRLMRRLLPYLRPVAWQAVLAVVLVIGGMSMFLVNPWLLGRIVDEGIKARQPELITRLALLYGFIELIVFLAQIGQNYLLQALGQRVMHDLRTDLLAHIQRLPVPFFDRNPVGRLVTRATNDVTSLAELFSTGLVVVLGDLFLILGITISLFLLQPMLAAATLSTIPLLALAAAFFQGRFRAAYRNVRTAVARLNSLLSESISGIKIIQIFNRQQERVSRFEALNQAHRDAQLQSLFYHALFIPIITVVNAITIIIILLLGGSLIIEGRLTTGVLVSFLAYAQHFFFPIRDISEKVGIFQSAMASAERVFALLDEPVESHLDVGHCPDRLNGEVQFEKVSFAYVPGRPVLHDLSFRVNPGESVAIVGHTGAGKTTIASLLNRFYEVSEGRILIDGHDLRSLNKPRLRRQLAVLQQEVFIFAGSPLENIRLWNEEIQAERVEAAAREIGADSFISRLPGGYGGDIFERGANLSSGQRQLLAFARAMAWDPRILVLDEATSAIDSETERLVQTAIRKLTRGRTCLIIAHRLSTIRDCNRILVLHHGILVEEGTHEELLQRCGFYHTLYEMQFKELSPSRPS